MGNGTLGELVTLTGRMTKLYYQIRASRTQTALQKKVMLIWQTVLFPCYNPFWPIVLWLNRAQGQIQLSPCVILLELNRLLRYAWGNFMSNRRWEIVKQLFEVHFDFAMTYYELCLCFLQSISGWFVLYIIKSGLKSTLSFITEVCPEYLFTFH